MTSLYRLFAVMKKELLQLRRDRLTFAMIIGIPLMQMLLFGYAINTDVRNLSAAVANQANTQLSREFIADLSHTQVFHITHVVERPEEIEALLRSGAVSMGVFVPPDFDRRVTDPTRNAAQLLIDGVDPTIAGVASQLAAVPLRFDTSPVRQPEASPLEIRPFFNPENRSAVFVVPGLVGIILTLTMMLFTSVAIVREREHGNLELIINTPVSTAQLMVGKVIPYIVVGLVQVALIVKVGQWLFKVPVAGSMVDLYLAACVFIAANLALGLLVSTFVKTQFQAIQITIFFIMPSILLSGFVFPFEGMPQLIQYIGEAIPNTHFIRLIRGIMLRDASLSQLSQELWILAGFTAVAMTVAILRFNKRLD